MSDINYVAHSATNCKLEEIAAPTPADPLDQASPRINSASVPNLSVRAMSSAFDFDSLRLPQNFSEHVGLVKKLTTVGTRKPHKQAFIRVRPDEEYRRDVPLIDFEEDDCFYAVAPNLIAELSDLLVPVTLFTAATRQGTVFLWPIRLPGPDGKSHASWDSQRLAAERAMKEWLRIEWNREAMAYEMFVAPGLRDEPTWPDLPFSELLSIAFRGRVIDSLDHIVVKKLRGLA